LYYKTVKYDVDDLECGTIALWRSTTLHLMMVKNWPKL